MFLNRRIGSIALAALILSGCQTVSQQSTETESQPREETPRFVKRSDAPAWMRAAQDSQLLQAENDTAKQDLWEITREHMALPEATDKEIVQSRIDWYASHDRYLDTVATRASRYYYYILNEVIDRGMPAEIALLPAIESSYDPFVKSPARAAGPWQFIPSTGDHFGLKRNWWYDGRRDIVESTQAALTYLTYLHNYFDGDWLLALAAYNAGEGNVRRAIKRNERAGKPTDFWSLDLPKETSVYVPKLLAVAEIFRNPQKFGLELNHLPNTPYFDIVETGGQIDIARAAELSGVDIKEIYQLNPGFSRWATDPEGPHRLLVPVEAAERFTQKLASLDTTERMSWARYEIRSGDTLSAIANRFNTSVASIRSTNNIDGNLIRVGQSLLIPSALMDSSQYTLSANQRTERRLNRNAPEGRSRQVYSVSAGDTLWSIARRNGVSSRDIARWNEMGTSETLRIGQQLVLFVKSSASDIAEGQYRVQKGDNLSIIAQEHDISVEELMRWNSLSSDALLMPGQQLRIRATAEQS